MRLLLLADGIVGERIAKYLIAAYPRDLVAVITVEENAIADHCTSAGIETFPFVSEQLAVERLGGSTIDLGILAWWPNIIRRTLMSLPQQGFINTHPSLLPHNRGKHYNFWALVEQAPFGVTLHQVTESVDAGPIFAQRCIAYDWTGNGETLYRMAQDAMAELFAETYPKLRLGLIAPIPQDLSQGSYHRASELNEASRIDLDRRYTARDLLNRLRARTFRGQPACWFQDDGDVFEVRVEITRKAP